ncbi:MAG: hypothetical protein ACJAUH_002763 [Saprospiraceae bacterium]|jgi:hypothetical protein
MSMSELIIKLKNRLVLTNEGGEPIIINNANLTFKWLNIFLEGEIAFSAFENIVDNELLGFDLDFVRPMAEGNMMLVGKIVKVKMALLPSTTLDTFDFKMDQAKFEDQVKYEINFSESELFQEYNWLVMTLSQSQSVKQVGHETIWNLVNFEHPDLFKEWDRIVDETAQQFTGNDGKVEDFFDSIQKGDVSQEDLSDMIKQAKDQMMNKDNPMSGMLSKMFGEGENFEDALSESMDMMMSMFGGGEEDVEEEDATDHFDMICGIISEHLDMLEVDYQFDEAEMVFMVKYKSMTTEKTYDTVIACGEDHLHVLTVNRETVIEEKIVRLYRLLNSMNLHIKLGKIMLLEESKQLIFRTELSSPVIEVAEEPIIDIIDENWTQAEDAFTIINQYLDNKLTLEEAIEEAIDVFM